MFSGIIAIAVGAYALSAAFGLVPLSRQPEANKQWLERFRTLIKICSPIVILYGLGEVFGLFQ